MKEIIVGYDGSDSAGRALSRGADLAEAFAAHLVVVSVTAPVRGLAQPVFEAERIPTAAGPAGMTMPIALPEVEAEPLPDPMDLARRMLDRARMTLASRRLDAEYVAEVGDPAERLVYVADRRDADLIVVGHGEHGLLERLFRRAVDEKVAQRATCDLLLVH